MRRGHCYPQRTPLDFGLTFLAINHNKLIQSEWQPIDACTVSLKGLNLDAVWENIVVQVGNIDIECENSLDEQILIDEKREKILK